MLLVSPVLPVPPVPPASDYYVYVRQGGTSLTQDVAQQERFLCDRYVG